MEIKVTVSLDKETLDRLSKVLGSEIIKPAETPKAEAPKKRGRPAKAAETSEDDLEEDTEDEIEEQEDEESEDKESEDDDSDEEIEDEETEDEETEDEAEKLDPEQLVKLRKALRSYSEKNGKEKASKVLKKFAPASQDVKVVDFKKLMAALKV